MTRTVVTYGLAPSNSLGPSDTLAPADTIYAGGPITPHRFLIGLAADGSLIDISTYVEFGEGITYTYGRQTQFDDTQPGTVTFTLNNNDGRFTPDNPNSPYARTVAEGTDVFWILGARTIHVKVLSVEIPSDDSTAHHLVVTADDVLGTAARHSFTSLPDGLLDQTGPKVLWKLDEDSDQQYGKETFGDPLGMFSLYRSNPSSTTEAVTFGTEQVAGLPGTAVTVAAAPGETNWFGTRHGNTVRNTNITSPYLAPDTANVSKTIGFYNFWVYPNSTINFAVVPVFAVENAGYAWSAQIRCTPSTYTAKPGSAAGYTYGLTAAEQLVPHYVSMRFAMVWQTSGNYWALYTALYVDGSFKGNAPWYDPQHGYNVPAYLNSLSPVEVSVSVTGKPSGASTDLLSGTVQRVSYTTNETYYGLERLALVPTLAGRVLAADFVGEDVNMSVANGALSTGPIGVSSAGNLLDLLNEIVRTEVGHVYARTTVTSGISNTAAKIRVRDRPATPAAVFNVTDDLDGLPTFVRDITNVAAQVEVSGPTNTVTVADATITGRYITDGTSETVLYTSADDLRLWGQDRLNRGKNRAVRAQQFTVNAVTTPIDRSVDLLNLVPGDRVQLTGLNSTRYGFSTWDGWVEGGSEAHTMDGNRFTFTLTPTLPTTAVYDTARYAAGGDLTLGNTYTAAATSMVFNAANAQTVVSTVVPYTILIDKEQLTVTAVSGSTWTVTRGANGTTAASHTVNAVIEIVPTAVYAY